MKYLQILIIFSCMLLPHYIFAQNKKPSVALVLSGGGAKGLAHIPLLQTLDSLGIVPDLIVGTSMGSIVGGLYAMGYSGDSIAAIANNANWDKLLWGDISLTDVGVEEKSELNQYLVDINLINWRPKPDVALLNDQNLRVFLSSLTYPVFNVKKFDDLPIPFRAIATDIVNGKEVILDEGFLSFAMRASMSIPSIFRPVPYKNTLLIDGGVLNNFAVNVAKEMGADIIIGSDVGGGMGSKEKLDNIADILFQTTMITSNLKYPANKELCNIIIEHLPNLKYNTEDFAYSKEIYEEGKIATRDNLKALVPLAEKLKKYPQREHILPQINDIIELDTIVFTNINDSNLDLIKGRMNIKSHTPYSTHDLINGINRAMGSNILSQITYKPLFYDDKMGLELNGVEKSKHQIKGSGHFDNYRGVGIILNYTGRNIIGKSSRTLVSLDIAEQPRFRIQNQKNFGPQKLWWWRSEAYGQQLEQTYYINGNKGNDFDYTYLLFENQINKNINSLSSYFGLGLNYEYTYLEPIINPEISDNINHITQYSSNNFELVALFNLNTMNRDVNANYGTRFQAKINRSIIHKVDVSFYGQSNYDREGKTNNFTKLGLDFEKRIEINPKITSIIGASAGFTFIDNLHPDDISFIDHGYSSRYLLGGNLIRPKKDDYILPGLKESELMVSQFIMLNLGFQFNPANNFYLTPHLNVATVAFSGFANFTKEAFLPNGNWQTMLNPSRLITAGTSASYNSFLGPISLDISWVNNINKVRASFSMGIHLNRSN